MSLSRIALLSRLVFSYPPCMRTLLITAALALSVTPALSAPPPAFRDLAYREAMTASEREGSTLLIKFTAAWCGPCKRMDRDTWSDEGVVDWLNAHDVTAIQVDVDHEKPVAREHRVRAMPTMVVFKRGEEFDRAVGYMGPAELLTWLGDVEAGQSRLDKIKAAAGDRAGKDGKVDVRARLDLARELTNAGDLEGATEEYVWLWKHMLEHEPAFAGVRGSFMARELEDLAARHEPAMRAFEQERDAAAAKLASVRDRMLRSDWIVLSTIVGDQDAVLAWIDSLKGAERSEALREHGYHFDDLLLERKRWADYGHTVRDVSQMIDLNRRMLDREAPEGIPEAQWNMIQALSRNRMMTRFAQTHAGLLAAGREAEAWTLIDRAGEFELEGLGRGVVRAALEAGEPRERHLDLLAEDDADLGERVREALREAKPDASGDPRP